MIDLIGSRTREGSKALEDVTRLQLMETQKSEKI
jgi:hypothetical protein